MDVWFREINVVSVIKMVNNNKLYFIIRYNVSK